MSIRLTGGKALPEKSGNDVVGPIPLSCFSISQRLGTRVDDTRVVIRDIPIRCTSSSKRVAGDFASAAHRSILIATKMPAQQSPRGPLLRIALPELIGVSSLPAVRHRHCEPQARATRLDSQGNWATARNPAPGSPLAHMH
jgi:hypothetical protein